MENERESTFCKDCCGQAELKVMCPMINPSSAGYTCVALFHCKRCTYFDGVDLETCRVKCSYKGPKKGN